MSTALQTTKTAASYLQRGLASLATLGISVPKDEPAPKLIEDLALMNPEGALTIAQTLKCGVLFNEAVRDNISKMEMGERYQNISESFSSILTDSKKMADRIENNRNGLREKIGGFIMTVSRGTIHSRFEDIRDNYKAVMADSEVQLRSESQIIEAYMDYRLALKEAGIVAIRMLREQEEKMKECHTTFARLTDEVSTYEDDEKRAEAEYRRDEAQRDYMTQKHLHEVAETVAENLKLSYTVGDTVIANLNQTHQIKEAVYNKATVFFATNENVFTSIDAAMTSTAGLKESSKTLDAMSAGLNASLEMLATSGTQVKIDALKSAHGPLVKAQAIRGLIDSIVKFQGDSNVIVSQLREESRKNTLEISTIVEEGKQKYAELTAKP